MMLYPVLKSYLTGVGADMNDKKLMFEKNGRGRTRTLSGRYPISFLLSLRRTWLLMTFLIGLAVLKIAIHFGVVKLPLSEDEQSLMFMSLTYLALGAALFWLMQLCYHELVRMTLRYDLEEGHFVISRGIIIKQRGLFPLSRITDVYLERSLPDLIFGLHTLHVSTPTELSERFARIDGLGFREAMGMQKELAYVLENNPPSPNRERAYSSQVRLRPDDGVGLNLRAAAA
ncbi:MAG: hypothetical protein DCC75_03285 [Proteobacteria bacterium]|nr:MAG: hypothetical protein DCC75_03285 [Pseudomonadota bacterium]